MSKDKAFDPIFEEKIIQTILVDHDFGEQILEVMNPDFFDQSHTQALSQVLIDYYFNYETFPSADLIPSIIENQIKNPLTLKRCNDYIKKIQEKPLNGDLEYVKERSLEFFRLQNIYRTLEEEVLPRIEKGSGKLEEIVPIIERAVSRGTDNDLGYEYLEDEEERFSEECIQVVPTSWPVVNKLLYGGGIGKGRVCTFIAPPGAGKTTMLCNVGKAALLQGEVVIHYTFEVDKFEVAGKYDASITGIEINDLMGNKKQVILSLREKVPKTAKLIIKEYPVRGASVQTIKSHLSKLKLRGIIPGMIIIDQGGNLKSIQKNKEERFNLSDNWIDMKNLGQTQNVPVVTAHQVNRTGYNDDLILPDQIAGCFDILGTTDIMITMARNVDQKKSGMGKLYFAKSRQGKDGIILAYAISGEKALIDIFEMSPEIEELIEQMKEKTEHEENLSLEMKLKRAVNKGREDGNTKTNV